MKVLALAALVWCSLLSLDGLAEPAPAPAPASLILRGESKKSFNDVILELDYAITERNFRITGRNTIGKGLRERGYEDFPDFEVIHFCNLENAREVLLIDPDFVAQMPCRLSVYRVGDRTVVNVVTLPEDHKDPRINAFAHHINGQLREILAFVMEQD